MRKNIARCALPLVFTLLAAMEARGQVVFHDAWLNWDFVNSTGGDVNNFEIVVGSPNFTPKAVYIDALGFPNFSTSQSGGNTVLTWSGRLFNNGDTAHVGAAMFGSRRILDAYWTTLGGQRVSGGSIAILYEKTGVNGTTGAISMILQATRGPDILGATVSLENIRTFMDIPADLLDLMDLDSTLDLGSLIQYETNPNPPQLPDIPSNSFVDVFVGNSSHLSQQFESLLVGDVLVNGIPTGRFWNLNPQSVPEPSTFALFGACTLGLLRFAWGRRKKIA